MCMHPEVKLEESRNPRMPVLRWRCTECRHEFKPVITFLERWRNRQALKRAQFVLDHVEEYVEEMRRDL